MDGLEEKLSSFLSDPSAMDQVLSMARMLGFGNTPDESASAPQPPEQPPIGALSPDDPMLSTVIRLVSEVGRDGGSQAALLNALRPFLRPERQEKIDQAVQIAKLIRIAEIALKQFRKE